eukprot:CAMPEP_0182451844 /NCGR_PEP_ID=MMETSP1172-20130603/43939_1 /TAXON_ID=708627 /ORGANISM="Timspurckia oligopyrenoides, Strain CCMP3278" /LENGTH=519 /DNA_ID=CAMNT_0024649651 /DNA_START=445 /DNA_END=2004 /DNA_ORIENTATION=-
MVVDTRQDGEHIQVDSGFEVMPAFYPVDVPPLPTLLEDEEVPNDTIVIQSDEENADDTSDRTFSLILHPPEAASEPVQSVSDAHARAGPSTLRAENSTLSSSEPEPNENSQPKQNSQPVQSAESEQPEHSSHDAQGFVGPSSLRAERLRHDRENTKRLTKRRMYDAVLNPEGTSQYGARETMRIATENHNRIKMAKRSVSDESENVCSSRRRLQPEQDNSRELEKQAHSESLPVDNNVRNETSHSVLASSRNPPETFVTLRTEILTPGVVRGNQQADRTRVESVEPQEALVAASEIRAGWYSCVLCDRVEPDGTAFAYHVTREHTFNSPSAKICAWARLCTLEFEETFQCRLCRAIFVLDSQLSGHLFSDHGEGSMRDYVILSSKLEYSEHERSIVRGYDIHSKILIQDLRNSFRPGRSTHRHSPHVSREAHAPRLQQPPRLYARMEGVDVGRARDQSRRQDIRPAWLVDELERQEQADLSDQPFGQTRHRDSVYKPKMIERRIPVLPGPGIRDRPPPL